MNLPNFFLADLPPEATLSPTMIRDASLALKRNRQQYLAERSTSSMIEVLSETTRNWLKPDDRFRQLALDLGPEATGFSRVTLANGLDTFFKQLTPENLRALLAQELGHSQHLDAMTATAADPKAQRAALARGPELLVHITSGQLPAPALMSMVLGLLARSAQFIKCASGASLIPRLFGQSLYAAEPKLAACLEIAEWRGGHPDLEPVLFEQANCVTATGSDETLAAIRQRLPARLRFLGYGHRVSFGYVTNNALAGAKAQRVAGQAVSDIVAWNQLGCLSPHVMYVEHGAHGSAEEFAEFLALELAKREEVEPRGPVSVEAAALIMTRRAFYEVRSAYSEETRHWFSPQGTAWTVIYEADPLFQVSCLNRFIYVKRVTGLEEALKGAELVRDRMSTVGLAATDDQAEGIAVRLARWGVTRVCPIGQMQNPPLTWRHDGRPSLGDLVTWTDWER
ncbi:MAG: acyl-CoA reductase [Limisphaerales bacterium]